MARIFAFISLIIILLISCGEEKPLIQNQQRIADIQRMLTIQKELTSKSTLPIWDIFKQPLTEQEKQSMEFLYAYMPLSDLADYKPEFFLKNVQMSLRAREEMPWGKTIPEEEFLHFVLPVRVNNENLDTFRMAMYDELKERVKGMSMKEAALEINHWCLEKVTYRGTDSRTSAPLSTIKKSFGRCGEESTFTVSAMRAVGIPALQIYTPRWAHSDDNHAWVEVWIDGTWNYLGACEPDADLNMGWFSEPVKRAMLLNSRAYGPFLGNVDLITAEDRFSELNLTSRYTTTKKVAVIVKNTDGTPADSAKVEFQLYNYAEYYPIATNYTNDKGVTSCTLGIGDLIVWASKDKKFGFEKLSVPEKDTLVLILNQTTPAVNSVSFDLIPPHAAKVETHVTEEARKANSKRMAHDDSIRGAYMKKAYRDSAWIVAFAERTKLPFDTLSRFFKLSYGNWDQIADYLEKNAKEYRSTLLVLANQLAGKDFSDVTEPILTDHLVLTNKSNVRKLISSDEIFAKYVLSLRIGMENLSPWRSFLSNSFNGQMVQSTRNDITSLTNWIRNNISINISANKHSRAPLTPIGVYNLRVADPVSRDIFFVAACRTFGIPARLSPETRFPEYYKNGQWYLAGFEAQELVQPEKGLLKLVNRNNEVVPKYSIHYTIAILRDGFYRTLNFREGEDMFASAKPLELETGNYALVTGNRLQDGSVLSQMNFFTIEKGKLSTIPVELRKQLGELKPSGKLNLDQLNLEKISDHKMVSISSAASGKHSVLVLLDPEKEPSKHILNDLGPYVDHFNKWGGLFVFAMGKEKVSQAGVLKTYKLPIKSVTGIDHDNQILQAVSAVYGDGLKDKLPLALYCDESGNVFMFSSGYKIGVGEQILKVISTIQSSPKVTVLKGACSK